MTKLAIENTRIKLPARAIGVLSMLMKALKPPTSWFQGKTQVNVVAVGIVAPRNICAFFNERLN
jgi:hypothetical protein